MENSGEAYNVSSLHYFSSAYLKHDTPFTLVFIIAYGLIFVIGFLGNVSVILVISRCPDMKTVTNYFILNLAVADVFVVLFCVPGTLISNLFIPWVFNETLCKTLPYVQGVSVSASVYSLVAISVDRCRALYCPAGQNNGFTKQQAKRLLVLIWIAGLFITSPWLFVFEVVRSDRSTDYGYPYCQEVWSNPLYGKLYFVSVHLLLCFGLPLLLISVLNLVIWWNMQKFQRVSVEQQLSSRYNTQGVTRLLCLISATFMLSWMPLYVLMTKVKIFTTENSQMDVSLLEVLIAVAQLMGSFNSCVNPILYAFHSKKFRECVAGFFQDHVNR